MRTITTHFVAAAIAAGFVAIMSATSPAFGPTDSIVVTESGVGIGTDTPEAPLN